MTCSNNPFVNHSFDRNGSHASERYVCTCENVDVRSLEQDLSSHISHLHYQFDCGYGLVKEDLDNLIELANAVKWEYENEP